MMQKQRTFLIVVDGLKIGVKIGGVKHCDTWKNSMFLRIVLISVYVCKAEMLHKMGLFFK